MITPIPILYPSPMSRHEPNKCPEWGEFQFLAFKDEWRLNGKRDNP